MLEPIGTAPCLFGPVGNEALDAGVYPNLGLSGKFLHGVEVFELAFAVSKDLCKRYAARAGGIASPAFDTPVEVSLTRRVPIACAGRPQQVLGKNADRARGCAEIASDARQPRVVGGYRWRRQLTWLESHLDAIDRAGAYAQFATRAMSLDNRVHEPGCTDDGVDRTRVHAKKTADTFVLADPCNRGGGFGRRRAFVFSQQILQSFESRFTARGTEVERRTIYDGLGVGTATGIAALCALSVWQQALDGIDELVAFRVVTTAEP